MEKELASLIGPSYNARRLNFHMPDFIDIVLNAGDSRKGLGATIGQSLPNWGTIAQEGRGRTMVTNNLYTDPESKRILHAQAASLLSHDAMTHACDEPRLQTLDIILHEASHNFGPHSDYLVNGRSPGDLFGPSLAVVLEELKAQTGAWFYVDFLRGQGLLSESEANQVYFHALVWSLGHIARGMKDASGQPLPYSQLAAVHLATLIREGAVRWNPQSQAANKQDQGCFEVFFDKIPAALKRLMQRVGRIKATGDAQDGSRLVQDCVEGTGYGSIHAPEIKERISRYPRASFVYQIKM
jgi:hypothetical protein